MRINMLDNPPPVTGEAMAPCDRDGGCPNRTVCKRDRMACGDFIRFVRQSWGRPLTGDRTPSALLFHELYHKCDKCNREMETVGGIQYCPRHDANWLAEARRELAA